MHLSKLVLVAPLALATPQYHRVDGAGDQLVIDSHLAADFSCDLPIVLDPVGDGLSSAQHLFSTKAALAKQVERHSALVKVPSICYDDLGPFDEDPRWAPFYKFHDVLAETFPLM